MISNKKANGILGLALSTVAAVASNTSTSSSHHHVTAFQQQLSCTRSRSRSSPTRSSLNNILRDYADYSPSRGPHSDFSGAQSTNWRKNQGYTAASTPGLFGGSHRDAETNPYYDPGWAQSTRRDNPAALNYDSGSNYNGYDDPSYYRENRGYWNEVTFPGVGDSYLPRSAL